MEQHPALIFASFALIFASFVLFLAASCIASRAILMWWSSLLISSAVVLGAVSAKYALYAFATFVITDTLRPGVLPDWRVQMTLTNNPCVSSMGKFSTSPWGPKILQFPSFWGSTMTPVTMAGTCMAGPSPFANSRLTVTCLPSGVASCDACKCGLRNSTQLSYIWETCGSRIFLTYSASAELWPLLCWLLLMSLFVLSIFFFAFSN
mmetsp:Transcript_137315/g.383052  ORF Transcript_137315/g.383052 Transcript_137315/m.383052 type:complete len:207 (-) Transcript_137315:756-1376(-)